MILCFSDLSMLISLILQIMLEVSIAVAKVTPSQLYEVVDKIVDLYINDKCLVVISSGGYIAGNHVSAVYVEPYKQQTQDNDSILNSEESYKLDTIAPVLEIGCTGYLIQTDNPSRQLRLIEKTFIRVNQTVQRKFILLPTTTSDTRAQDEVLDSQNFNVKSVLLTKSVQYIPDLIFAIPNDEADQVTLLTHRFTGTEEISRQEMILDTYSVAEARFELGVDLFPDKVADLEGKVLVAAVFHYPPAIVINEDNGKIEADGSEWRYAHEFARHHNCSLKPLIDNDGAWGVLQENLTGTGATGNLIEDKADFAICSLFTGYERSFYLDFSPPFHRSGIRCLVPQPPQLPPWMSPILPFTPVLWLTVVGMTIVSVIFTWIVNRMESIIRSKDSFRMSLSEATLTVLGITLLQGLMKDPKGSSWAGLSTTLLITSVLLSTGYGSSLASALTVPRYESPIDTPWELAASGFAWVAAHVAWIIPIIDADEPEMKTLVKNFDQLMPEVLNEYASAADDWAFPIELIQGNYLIPDYLTHEAVKKLHLMRSDIYWQYCAALLRKSSPFTRWFGQRILEVHASGVHHDWQADVGRRYLDRPTQLAVEIDNVVEHGPAKITSNQLLGAFFILGIGLVISGLVFLGEILAVHKFGEEMDDSKLGGYLRRCL